MNGKKKWKSEEYAIRVKLGIKRLDDLMETGKINFNRKGCKKYLPNAPEHLYLANEIINSNSGFKAKILSAIIRIFFAILRKKKQRQEIKQFLLWLLQLA